MRIDSLYIDAFKNLNNFSINFDEKEILNVIVGRNGTGKSNVLEALVIIFRDLDLNEDPEFSFEVNYRIRSYRIKVRGVKSENVNQKGHYNFEIIDQIGNSETLSRAAFMKNRVIYLPKYVFGYYSGPSNRLEEHFDKHQKNFYEDLFKEGEGTEPLRPLLYARLVHSQFVLLSFFIGQNSQHTNNNESKGIKDFLLRYLRIEGLDSILFVLNEPSWYQKNKQVPDGNPYFWNARGFVKIFLEEVQKLALAPMKLSWRIAVNFRKSSEREHIYLYLPGEDDISLLAERYISVLGDVKDINASRQSFFKALESTYISELLKEIRIRVKIQNVDGSLTFRELSEGEQQLIMVLGLLRFTREDESLFLLDEPDTHLNPNWSLRYLDFIDQVVGKDESSHLIMTTHNPLTIASLKSSQVSILFRDDETNQVHAAQAEQDPKGMGVAGVLMSDIFGLRSTLDPETLRLLDEKRLIATKSLDELSHLDKKRLEELNNVLDKMNFNQTSADPLYQQFMHEMTLAEQREGLQIPVLTKEQQEKRASLAASIVAKLRDKQQ